MNVIFTRQAINSLEEGLRILIEEMGIPKTKVGQIKNALLKKAGQLEAYPYLGQHEEYLEHLSLGHRRVIEGNLKLYIG